MTGRVAVGLALRDEQADDLLALYDRSGLDLLEVMVDDLLHAPMRAARVRRLGARWPLVAHGTELAIGDARGVSEGYVREVSEALHFIAAGWYSEHLAFRSSGDGAVRVGHFAPLSGDEDTLRVVAENARRVREETGRALLLENPWDVLGWDADGEGAPVRLATTYGRFLEAAEAGALLDLTNLVLDARNGGWSVGPWLDALPWDRVVEVHLAGGHQHDGLWVDSHAYAIDDEALALVPEVVRRAPSLRAVIVERDERLPRLGVMLGEVERVRRVLR